jgi:hypothetical protein
MPVIDKIKGPAKRKIFAQTGKSITMHPGREKGVNFEKLIGILISGFGSEGGNTGGNQGQKALKIWRRITAKGGFGLSRVSRVN